MSYLQSQRMRTGTLVCFQRNFVVRMFLAWVLLIGMGVLPESTWQQQRKGLKPGRSLEPLHSVQYLVWQIWGTAESTISSTHNSQAVNRLGNWTVQIDQLWHQSCSLCGLVAMLLQGYAAWGHTLAIRNCENGCRRWQTLSLQSTQNHAGILHRKRSVITSITSQWKCFVHLAIATTEQVILPCHPYVNL